MPRGSDYGPRDWSPDAFQAFISSIDRKKYKRIESFLRDIGVRPPSYATFMDFLGFYMGEEPQQWGMDEAWAVLTGYPVVAFLAKVFFEDPEQTLRRWQRDLNRQIMRPNRW